MARVTVEQSALLDRRFTTLGRLIGENRFAALGRMLLLWHECQERETYEITAVGFLDMFPDIEGFGARLVEADLAVEVRDGVYYIKGTKGRIEWLAKKRATGRENGNKGGRPKKTNDRHHENTKEGYPPETNEGYQNGNAKGFPSETPPAPALALKDKKPVPEYSQEHQGEGGGSGPPGRAMHTQEKISEKPKELRVVRAGPLAETEVDQEIMAIKGLLAIKCIPAPANGAIANRVRQGARLDDAMAAVDAYARTAPKRRLRDPSGFWVQLFEDHWRERQKLEGDA